MAVVLSVGYALLHNNQRPLPLPPPLLTSNCSVDSCCFWLSNAILSLNFLGLLPAILAPLLSLLSPVSAPTLAPGLRLLISSQPVHNHYHWRWPSSLLSTHPRHASVCNIKIIHILIYINTWM